MKKILIVDDDPITLKLVEQYLSSQGYNTITAMDGFDALEKIEKNKFDLIITDIMMPNLSGLSLFSISKKIHSEIPILFISSLDKGDIISKSLGLGAKDFIVKPINLEELSIRIKRLLPKQENTDVK